MRFSAFLTTRSAGPDEDRRITKALVDHAVDVERLGFDAVFLPDHHFTGYCPPASDPMMFASFLAARLPRLYYGFSVQTIALHHPVRFAERLNLLDQLTDGKLLVGTGSGTTPEEMIGLGINFKDTPELSKSHLALVRQLWDKKAEDEPFVFDNGHYKGAVVSRIVPASYTEGGPQLMSVALRPSSVERAAAEAQPAFIPAFTPPALDDGEPLKHLRTHFTAYRTALEAAGHPQDKVARALEWTTHLPARPRRRDGRAGRGGVPDPHGAVPGGRRARARGQPGGREAVRRHPQVAAQRPGFRMAAHLVRLGQPGHRCRAPPGGVRDRHRQRARRIPGRSAHPGAC